jgi:hypothetical protein
MNYTRHRRAIEKLYTDKATITGKREVTAPNGATRLEPDVPICVDQPCRISQKSLPTNNQTEAQNDIQYEIKLFIAPELEIQQGDVVEVTSRGIIRKYQAGEPFPPYPTHQEVSLQRRGYA